MTMLDVKKTPLQPHPSLLPLRKALIVAERESPSRPQMFSSADEQLVSEFIAKVQKVHRRDNPFLNLKEMAG
jgi:hypothetical protein